MNTKIAISGVFLFAITSFSTHAMAQAEPYDCNGINPCLIVDNNGSGLALNINSAGSTAISAFADGTGSIGATILGENEGSIAGVEGLNESSGEGVQGISFSNNGVEGSALSTGTSGVYGHNSASGGYGVAGRMTASGNTGIAIYGDNNNSGGWLGYFNGNVHVTGTLTQSSDARLKKNIAPLSGALDQLLNLHGVTYEWRDGNRGAGVQSGFIAQDVEKVFPQWVGVDPDGFKTLNTRGLEALTVESIRTLKMENDTLKSRIKALENGRPMTTAGLGAGGPWMFAGLALLSATLIATRRKRAQSAGSTST